MKWALSMPGDLTLSLPHVQIPAFSLPPVPQLQVALKPTIAAGLIVTLALVRTC